MKRLMIFVASLVLIANTVHAGDWAAQQEERDRERAAYWAARGYNFDAEHMTAWSMDQKVKDIERAKYWKQKGYDFDPDHMTAWSMDQRVKDIERAKYWKKRGYSFNPDHMTAWSMDQAVKNQGPAQNEDAALSDEATVARRAALLQPYQEALRKQQQTLSGTKNDRFLSFDTDEEDNLGPLLEVDDLSLQLPSLPELPRVSGRSSQDKPDLGEKTKRGTYLGQWSTNEFDPDSINNPFGAGNKFSPNSINNEFGKYGSEFSPNSPRNPFATDAPKLYDSQGNYRGKLSSNEFDPDSISNPFGRYGNPFWPDSVNNPFGAGNPFSPDSPNNPFGRGLSIYGDE